MRIKPIKSERDYQRALKLVDRLMDARANTPEGDMLDVLATLIDAWEEKHYPIDPPDPIEAIRFAMEQRGQFRKHIPEPLLKEVSRPCASKPSV